MRFLFFAIALAVSTSAQAEIYKCTIGGKVTFSDRACPEEAASTTVEVNVPKIGTSNYRDGLTASYLTRDRQARETGALIRMSQDNIYKLRGRINEEKRLLEQERQRQSDTLSSAINQSRRRSEIYRLESDIIKEQMDINAYQRSIQ